MLRKILLTILVSVPLLATAGATNDIRAQRAMAAYALSYVCDVLNDPCIDLAPPRIEYATPAWPSVRGWFSNSDWSVVWINAAYRQDLQSVQTADPRTMATLIHETTHYVHINTLGFWPGTRAGMCLSESMAWSVANVWLVEHGHEDLADYGWRARYGCPVIQSP